MNQMLKSALSVLITVSVIKAGFIPSVRVDRENRPNYGCFHAAITLGPGSAGSQPVYVVIQDDSMAGMVTKRSDIIFQRSTDQGRTWLEDNILIRRGNVFTCYPDIVTDAAGSIYVVYTEGIDNLHSHLYCVRSTDNGNSWSSPVIIDDNPGPVPIGWARLAVDSAGNLFAAWNGNHNGRMAIWSSVSTDHGSTWLPSVRVDDDTVPGSCFHTDVAIQPGTNHYFVVASAPYWSGPGQISYHSYCYRSTDLGRSFQPGFQLDTFDGYCAQPHIVADSRHIICDYTGSTRLQGNRSITESRTLYTLPDTWAQPVPVTYLDPDHVSEYNGNKLAISPDGRVHIALMIFDLISMQDGIFYASSNDYGASWSVRERVNEDSINNQSDPDIAVDANGCAYIVWQDGRNNRQEIWFSTNSVVGAEEKNTPEVTIRRLITSPSVFSSVTEIRIPEDIVSNSCLPISIYDAAGGLVRTLLPRSNRIYVWDGCNNSGIRCLPGVYIIRAQQANGKVLYQPER
ncbi:MAG: hypothetical protein ABIK51_07525 [candidate division WOR-3 bacterium]